MRVVRIVRDETGSASVVAAGIIAAMMSLVLAVVSATALVAARHEAQVAADLSAVAGAFAHYRGEDGCRAAGETARHNGAELAACGVADGDVTVTARVRTRSAQARAGPL